MMPSKSEKLKELFQSTRKEDHNQAAELLQTLGPLHPEVCVDLFTDLSNPFATCILPRAIQTPQLIMNMLNWMLQAKDSVLDSKLFQIERINLSDGLLLHESLSRLPNTLFSLEYTTPKQAIGWIKTSPMLKLEHVVMPFHLGHLQLMNHWSCKHLTIQDWIIGTIQIDLAGSGTLLNEPFPISLNNRNKRMRCTYTQFETCLHEFLGGRLDKVRNLNFEVTDTVSLQRILNKFPTVKHLQVKKLTPDVDWAMKHPIQLIEGTGIQLRLAENSDSTLGERIQFVQCSEISAFSWPGFPSLRAVYIGRGNPDWETNEVDSTSEQKRVVRLTNDSQQWDVNQVVEHFRMPVHLSVGCSQQSFVFNNIDWTQCSPITGFSWDEEDLDGVLTQELVFDTDTNLSIKDRVISCKSDIFYSSEMDRFPNLTEYHIYNCLEDISESQQKLSAVNITTSNRISEIRIQNYDDEFHLNSELSIRQAIRTHSDVDSLPKVWNEMLFGVDMNLLQRHQESMESEEFLLNRQDRLAFQWFIKHCESKSFYPTEHRTIFFRVLIAVYIYEQTYKPRLSVVSEDVFNAALRTIHKGIVGQIQPQQFGEENLFLLMSHQQSLPYFQKLLHSVFSYVGGRKIVQWLEGTSHKRSRNLFVNWYIETFDPNDIQAPTQRRPWYKVILDSNAFCEKIWEHSRIDFGVRFQSYLAKTLKKTHKREHFALWLGTLSVVPKYHKRMDSELMLLAQYLLEEHDIRLLFNTLEIVRFTSKTQSMRPLLKQWWNASEQDIALSIKKSMLSTDMLQLVQWMYEQDIWISVSLQHLLDEDTELPNRMLLNLSEAYLQQASEKQVLRVSSNTTNDYLFERLEKALQRGVFIDSPKQWTISWLKRSKTSPLAEEYMDYWAHRHNVYSFQFKGWSVTEVIETLPFLPDETIHLEIVDCDIEQFPSSILRFTQLKKLMLYGTKLVNIPDEIASLNNLEDLSISFTQIAVLPTMLKELPNIKRVYARGLTLSLEDQQWLDALTVDNVSTLL